MAENGNDGVSRQQIPPAHAISILEELKRRTPSYMGERPKALHYQAVHAAYDMAIEALRRTQGATE